MNRREFLGANLVALIAALCLPFEQFEAWLKSLFGEPRPPFFGVNRSTPPETLKGLRLTAESFERIMKKAYGKHSLPDDSPFFRIVPNAQFNGAS
jgi:hypothetical protein